MFTNGKRAINVRTVADAIRELSLLPPNMRMDQNDDDNGSDLLVEEDRKDPTTHHVAFGGGCDYEDIYGPT